MKNAKTEYWSAESQCYICPNCGAEISEEEALHIIDDECYCEECVYDEFERCERCGEWVSTYDLVKVYDNDGVARRREYAEYWCEDCATYHAYKCCECGDYFQETSYEYNCDALCAECFEEFYYSCEDCGEVIHGDHVNWINDHPYCDSCADDHRESDLIADWHDHKGEFDAPRYTYDEELTTYDPGNLDHLADRLTFGYEQEVVPIARSWRYSADTCAEDLDDGFYFFEHDGSLSDGGFEIITQPASLAFHMEQHDIDRACRIISNNGFGVDSSCGLHVHVGRHNLGRDWSERHRTAGKLVALFYTHYTALCALARRTESHAREWADTPNLQDTPVGLLSAEDFYERGNFSRYMAVNLCNNETIEFRLWGGSSDADTIRAMLQLSSNLCRYAMTHPLLDCITCDLWDVINIRGYAELEALALRTIGGMDTNSTYIPA